MGTITHTRPLYERKRSAERTFVNTRAFLGTSETRSVPSQVFETGEYPLTIDAQRRAMCRRSTWSTYFAQRSTMCSASRLAEERSIFSPLQSQLHANRRAPMCTHSEVHSFRSTTNFEKVNVHPPGLRGSRGLFPASRGSNPSAGGGDLGKNGPKRPRHPRHNGLSPSSNLQHTIRLFGILHLR
jgi:hypothetical protein